MRNIKIRPTLVIGLGGSGTQVVRMVKAKFEDRYGDDHPLVNFLAIDTDESTTGGKELLPKKEFLHLANFRGNEFIENLNDHPHIKAWWKSDYRPSFIVGGAHGIRAIGRLALFAKFEEFKKILQEQLESPWSEAVQQEADGKLTPEHLKFSSVYVIGSICGGTGTGMLLDVALLARHFIDAKRQADSRIQGTFFLPSVFEGAVTPQRYRELEINAAACLRDINYVHEVGSNKSRALDVPIRYNDPAIPEIAKVKNPPFNSIFLVGRSMGAESVSHRLKSPEEVFERTADMVVFDLTSATGVSIDSAMDNVKSTYASFGITRKWLPDDLIRKAWCFLASDRILERGESNFESYEEILKSVGETQPELNDIVARCNAMSLPNDLNMQLNISQNLNTLSDSNDLVRARALMSTLLEESVSKVRRNAQGVCGNPQEKADAITKEIQRGTVQIFRRTQGSLFVVHEYLDRTLKKLPLVSENPNPDKFKQEILDILAGPRIVFPWVNRRRTIERAASKIRRDFQTLLTQVYRAELWRSSVNLIEP